MSQEGGPVRGSFFIQNPVNNPSFLHTAQLRLFCREQKKKKKKKGLCEIPPRMQDTTSAIEARKQK
jgi:hypothetical protein